MPVGRIVKTVIALLAAAIVLMLPADTFGIVGLTVLQQRVMALFVFAMFFWVLEPIPIFATSVMIIVLELLFMSNKSIKWLKPPDTLHYEAVMHNFADPIIMLFLGGFFIGAAATKYRMDINLGRVLLKPFGTNPKWVMLGMMIVTAIFSMFMSNTATTAMMLAVLMPVLRSIAPEDPARVGFALSIPFAANVGGIGTPIGTPPNAVAMKYLTPQLLDSASTVKTPLITFGQWMLFAVPYMLVLLVITWLLLLFMFKPKADKMTVNFEGKWLRSGRAWVVYVTSALTILLWLLGSFHGMSSTVVAMIPVGVFCATGVIDSNDLKQMSWEVLWLMSGGFALGMALQDSGLANALVNSIPFASMSAMVVLALVCILTFVMANFMSHTATSNLILPVVATLATALPTLGDVGGPVALLLACTFCASLSMTFPISTPPNAMAYATGWIENRDMAKSGLITGVIGLLLLGGMLMMLKTMGYFATFGA
ncbi:SLC13/DASS family transporter [Planctomycetales bacterium ZRK34]|nr:SLC13/DASS family transporter [Planctomycetales bacterium ZRK34]